MESQKEFWNIDASSGALLQALIHAKKPKEILEVGTSNGYSAIRMGKVAKQYGGHITTLEFFEGRVLLAKSNIEKEKLSDTITVVQGDAVEILANFSPSYEGEREGVVIVRRNHPHPATMAGAPPYPRGRERRFDFIFLDANKEEYALYFHHAMQIITAGGVIVADNTISHEHKLKEFFQAVQDEPRASMLPLSIGTGLMIITIT